MKYFFCMRCILCKSLYFLFQNSHPSIYTSPAHLYPHFPEWVLLLVPILECVLNAVLNHLELLLLAYKWSSHSHTPPGLSYCSWWGPHSAPPSEQTLPAHIPLFPRNTKTRFQFGNTKWERLFIYSFEIRKTKSLYIMVVLRMTQAFETKHWVLFFDSLGLSKASWEGSSTLC